MAEYSPMMQQYLDTKEQYKDCILFYRLGDFYEMFFDDAITASRELELTLTGRDCGQEERAPMCGVPFHAAEVYISRLIGKGYKVAICEQLEEPFGIKIDKEINMPLRGKEGLISTSDSKVKVVVIPTDEEVMIARDTVKLLKL